MSEMRLFTFICFLFLSTFFAFGQSGEERNKRTPTENIDTKIRGNKFKNRPKRKQYAYIYKENTEGILYGNPCALEATRKMGFEYVVQTSGLPGSLPKEDVNVNNFLVNLKLIFTRSPFWKIILNNKLKKCQQKSGDIVG